MKPGHAKGNVSVFNVADTETEGRRGSGGSWDGERLVGQIRMGSPFEVRPQMRNVDGTRMAVFQSKDDCVGRFRVTVGNFVRTGPTWEDLTSRFSRRDFEEGEGPWGERFPVNVGIVALFRSLLRSLQPFEGLLFNLRHGLGKICDFTTCFVSKSVEGINGSIGGEA